MKYLTICRLSLASMWSAASSPAPVAAIAPLLEPAALDAAALQAGIGDSALDPVLMFVVAGALAALQLRRRQRALRTPTLRL
jgi:hypothetical protein